MPSAAVRALLEIKTAIIQGDRRDVLVGLCRRAVRELENLERTGGPTPPNTLAVQR